MNRRRVLTLAAASVGAAAMGAIAGAQRWAPAPSPPSRTTRPPTALQAREFVRLDAPVMEFTSIGGPPIWSPDATSLAIERAERLGHVVDVARTRDWSVAYSTAGSRPTWSPDGVLLALVDPFAPTVPPDPTTVVRVVEPANRTVRREETVAAFGLGWVGTGLYGVVDGAMRSLQHTSTTSTALVQCPGGCETAEWAPSGRLVTLTGNQSPYPIEVHDLAKNPSLVASPGVVDALTWAPAAHVLAWASDGRVYAWASDAGIREIRALAGLRPVFWSAHAEILFCRDDRSGTWMQWSRDADTAVEARFPNEIGGGVRIACSPDNALVAVVMGGARTSSVRVYPLVTA